MQIAKKIYYDLTTGNVIQEIGEREGSVVETTQEQDFSSYISLTERVPSTVGVIQLTYGQYVDKFGVYYYSVDITTNTIVWGDLINIDAPIPQPTNQELSDNQLIIMSAMADLYDALAPVQEETMTDLYYKLIKAGRKTIGDVPVKFRAEVQVLLDEDN